MTDLVVHGCHAVSVMKINWRGERGRPVREGRLAVASGGTAGCITTVLGMAVIREGDGRGGKRGGHETHKRYCIFLSPPPKLLEPPSSAAVFFISTTEASRAT
jgi:hypothetical protein